MESSELAKLADEIQGATEINSELAHQLVAAVNAAAPLAEADRLKVDDLASTDAIICAINHALPGWSISLKGTASHQNGHWNCTLRSSGVLDNDAFIGICRGPVLPCALLGALLKTLAQRQPG